MTHPTFEALREDLETLTVPTGIARSLRWLAPPLAVARSATGDFEIFIRGGELFAASVLVRRHLQYGDWQPEGGGETFPANRIVLPSAPHFASVAALIAVELLRAGLVATAAAQTAFADVEPIIEMAIRRGALPENVVVGLIGELMVLRQGLLSLAAQPQHRALLLDAWQGWQGGRDFRLGPNSIEVKTTQAESSIHEFAGLHQLEEARFPSGSQEELHLLSIGLAGSPSMGETLPGIIDQILEMLRDVVAESPLQETFLSRVERYGTANGVGYQHATMKDWTAYATRYTATFAPRLYRVADPAMRLLNRAEVANTFVVPGSLAFTLHIPDRVSAFNPATNWQAELSRMIAALHTA